VVSPEWLHEVLPAWARKGVHHKDVSTGLLRCSRRGKSSRPCSNDEDVDLHTPAGHSVSIRIPSVNRIMQALTFGLPFIVTRQSKQVPMPQNTPRDSPLRLVFRNRGVPNMDIIAAATDIVPIQEIFAPLIKMVTCSLMLRASHRTGLATKAQH
jgi:hypothetical protein